MRAAQISEYGDASVVRVNVVDKPVVKTGQVLVEVYASSINPFDSKLRSGYMKEVIPLQFPFTLGGDIAGVISEVGEDVEGFSVGDTVYGQAAGVAGNSGAFAEYAATAANQVAKAPSNLGFNEAASLPLVGVSALQALTLHIKLQPGQKILITGGAGGIGQVAVQLAKHLGAHVATTVSGEDVEFVRSLGADEAIDYQTQDFTQLLSGYDAVFDTVGGEGFTKALSVLKAGGIGVSMAAQADKAKATELSVTAMTQSTQVTTEALNNLRQLIESGVVKPRIGKEFGLDEIQQAFVAAESGGIKGKIVIEIKST